MQLLRKISSIQVKPRSLKFLQQIIEDITYYMLTLFVGYASVFLRNTKVILAFLAKT